MKREACAFIVSVRLVNVFLRLAKTLYFHNPTPGSFSAVAVVLSVSFMSLRHLRRQDPLTSD